MSVADPGGAPQSAILEVRPPRGPRPIAFLVSAVLLSSAAACAVTTATAAEAIGDNSSDALKVATAATATDLDTDGLHTVEISSSRETTNSARPLEALQDTPQSTSVVTGDELERLNAVRLGDITERAANVSWNLGNSRTSSLSIRGIGKQAQTDAMDPSVGVVVDSVPYAYNPLSSFDFTDLADVQVERGPTGTQGGRSANLGLLNITTRRPTFDQDQASAYSLTFGDYRTIMARAATGGTIIDNLLAWRGAVAVDKGDGAIKNAYNPDYSYPNMDNVSGRVQFLFDPSSTFNALVRLDLEPRHNEFYNGWVLYTPTPTRYANGATNPLNTDAATRLARSWFTQEGNYSYLSNYLGDNPNLDNQDPLVTSSKGGSAELNWTWGSHTLTSITAYKDYQFQARNDEGTPFDISKNGGGHVYYHQSSEELRLSSRQGGFVDYRAGVYLLTTGNNYDSGTGDGADAGAWFATPAQYSLLDADGSGRYLLANSLNRLNFKPLQQISNKSAALYAQANWHFTDSLNLLTGVRATREDRTNEVSKLIYDNGNAPELNPVAVNGVQLGGFDSNSAGNLTANNSATQLALANATALKYFGVATYGALGSGQKSQLAAAKAIRASQLGVLWNPTEGPAYRATQPGFVFSPSYKISDAVTAYVSYRHGEKAGISQVVNGVGYLAAPEKSDAYELGFKSSLLNKTLVIDADLFWNDIRNYQQAVQVYDAYTTLLKNDTNTYYTAATGNAAKVRATGLEFDSVYTPTQTFSVRLSGAYNNAVFKDFKNSGQPLENGNLPSPYRDVTGQNLPGAARFTANLGVDYHRPVLSGGWFHTSLNYAYTTRYNSDPLLSSYGWVPAYGIVDYAIGLGRVDDKFDVTVLAKNLFNNQTSQVVLWNSYIPVVPRWVGVQFSSKL